MNDAVKRQPHAGAPRGRGRPRSDKARQAILRAARELIDEHGPAGLTMEGIAARAGVGKPTVYRWWPDRHSVAMAALMESENPAAVSGGGSPLSSLRKQLERVVEVFAAPVGRAVATMIASADSDSELAKAFRNHFILARREEGRALLQLAQRRGEIRRDANIEITLDMIYGALFYRLLMGHAPLDTAAARLILREALQGLRS
jgi:AcrR family transcriptional regulator